MSHEAVLRYARIYKVYTYELFTTLTSTTWHEEWKDGDPQVLCLWLQWTRSRSIVSRHWALARRLFGSEPHLFKKGGHAALGTLRYAAARMTSFTCPPKRGGCAPGRSRSAGAPASPCRWATRRGSRPQGWRRGRLGGPLCDRGSRTPPEARRT